MCRRSVPLDQLLSYARLLATLRLSVCLTTHHEASQGE